MTTAHKKGNGRDFGKKGMTVAIRKHNNNYGETSSVSEEKQMESAIKTLKRRMVHEGVVRDIRRKEQYESKGQIKRRKKEVAIRRQKIAEKEREY